MSHPQAPSRDSQGTRPAASSKTWIQVGPIQDYQWNIYQVPLATLPRPLDGLRIVHLSDVHFARHWHPGLDSVITRLTADPPDLICITGDLVDDKYDPRPAIPFVQRLLTQLPAQFGVYAILGNHDGDLLGPRLPRWGVHLIDNAQLRLNCVPGADIELIGLAGPHREDLFYPAFSARIAPQSAGALRIVLSHFPDALPLTMQLQPDLFLAGHTHGGQVCLPGGVPILRHDTLPRRLCSGLHRVGHTWLCVSRGMGYTNAPIRMFCAAEVVELRLAAAE